MNEKSQGAEPADDIEAGTASSFTTAEPVRSLSAEDLGIPLDHPAWCSEEDIEAMFGAPREDEDEDLDHD